jgi:hypothetical protein
MKPIVRKIIESGLVDCHAVQTMERWGQIDRGSSELVGKNDIRTATKKTLTKFAEDIDELLEQDRETARETRLVIQLGEPLLATWQTGGTVVLFKDEMNNFMFPLQEEQNIHPGAVFRTTDGAEWQILSKEMLFVDDQPYTIQVLAEKAE